MTVKSMRRIWYIVTGILNLTTLFFLIIVYIITKTLIVIAIKSI